MNYFNKLSCALILSLSLHAEEIVSFRMYKQISSSMETVQTLYKGIEKTDIAMVCAALDHLSSIDTISIGTLGDTPLMFAVRKYLQNLITQEKVSPFERIIKERDQQTSQSADQKRNVFYALIPTIAMTGLSVWIQHKEIHQHLTTAIVTFGFAGLIIGSLKSQIPPIKTTLEHQRDIIELLLKATHDVTIRNHEGINLMEMLTAYHLSVLSHHQDVAALLNTVILKSGKYALPEHALNDIMEQFIAFNQNRQ